MASRTCTQIHSPRPRATEGHHRRRQPFHRRGTLEAFSLASFLKFGECVCKTRLHQDISALSDAEKFFSHHDTSTLIFSIIVALVYLMFCRLLLSGRHWLSALISNLPVMPYAVEVPLPNLLIHRTVYGKSSCLEGCFELTMIPFCGIQLPSVVFKHLDDLLRFICLHIYSGEISPHRKGNKINTASQTIEQEKYSI